MLAGIMPSIGEIDGTRIMLVPFDHDPPHVHAFGADFRVKLGIADARVLETRGTVGLRSCVAFGNGC